MKSGRMPSWNGHRNHDLIFWKDGLRLLLLDLAGLKEPELEQSAGWVPALELLLEAGVSASRAAFQVSQKFGVKKREVYGAALEKTEKKSKDSLSAIEERLKSNKNAYITD